MSAVEPIERVLPCEGCGAEVPVVIYEIGRDLISETWANGGLTVWCPDCWPEQSR